jgi:outer membrane lipoprotein LolB
MNPARVPLAARGAGLPGRSRALRPFRLPAILVLVLLQAGCSLLMPPPPAPEAAVDPTVLRARLLALVDWEARGRIAVKADGRGAQGNLRWVQAEEDARIRVSGPFGAGTLDIHWRPDRLTVASRDGEVAADYAGADAAEQFLAARLGWSFPVVSTRYWMLGVADPGAPAQADLDETGRLARLRQHGWEVSYEEFVRLDGLWLPRKFAMESPRGRLRVVVDEWRL